ncbi:phage antirepressor KilAC domain-containing protein [Malaciobacter sp. WC5094]
MIKNEVLKVDISEEVIVEVQPHEEYEWLLSSKDVAEGYGLSDGGLRSAKSKHSDEFEEGKHFITVANRNANPRAGIPHSETYWTKEGVVMLGFFIKTPTAKEFRRWASNFIVEKSKEPKAPVVPQTYIEALQAHLESVKELEEANKVISLQAPKVEAYDELIDTDGCVNLTYPAKKYGYKNGQFLSFLRHKGWIKKNSRETVSYLPAKVEGWFKDVVSSTGHKNVKVTPKGLIGLKEYMSEYAEYAKEFYKDSDVRL